MTPPPAPSEPADPFDEQLAHARERFDVSTDFTLGIEEEFAICNPETLDLEPRFDDFAELARGAGLEQALAGELLASEIEFRTGRCERWSDAVSELTDIRRRVVGIAREGQALFGASATHPWADYREQATVDLPYYRKLVRDMGFVARRNNTFGLHVHVGVRGADRAIRVADALRPLAPLLLALSGSSPFLDGIDTQFASSRSITFSRGFPRANVAPAFGTLDGYLEHLRWLKECRAIRGTGQVWWGTRPHVLHGTVELRMFDGQPDVRDTLALAALAVGTIAHLCALHDAGELPPVVETHMIDENAWRAARWGTEAKFIDTPTSRIVCADEAIGILINNAQAASDANALALDAGLDRAREILAAGSSSAWQRELFEQTGDLATAYRAVCDATMSSAEEPAFR